MDRNILALPPGDLRLREVPLDGDISYGSTLSFEYVVQPGDSDSNGLTIVGSGLSGLGEGTIAFERLPYTDGRYADIDFPGETIWADHSYPSQDNLSGHMVDGRPYVTDVSIVSSPADGTAYRNEENIKVRMMFNDPVVVVRPGRPITGEPMAPSCSSRTG